MSQTPRKKKIPHTPSTEEKRKNSPRSPTSPIKIDFLPVSLSIHHQISRDGVEISPGTCLVSRQLFSSMQLTSGCVCVISQKASLDPAFSMQQNIIICRVVSSERVPFVSGSWNLQFPLCNKLGANLLNSAGFLHRIWSGVAILRCAVVFVSLSEEEGEEEEVDVCDVNFIDTIRASLTGVYIWNNVQYCVLYRSCVRKVRVRSWGLSSGNNYNEVEEKVDDICNSCIGLWTNNTRIIISDSLISTEIGSKSSFENIGGNKSLIENLKRQLVNIPTD